MKKIDLVLYIVLAAIIVIGIFIVYGLINDKTSSLNNKKIQIASELKTISTGSADSGDVAIDLTPIRIDDKSLVLSVALNTHSVDLSQFDLRQVVTLKYNGKTTFPIEAPGIEWYHSSGNI